MCSKRRSWPEGTFTFSLQEVLIPDGGRGRRPTECPSSNAKFQPALLFLPALTLTYGDKIKRSKSRNNFEATFLFNALRIQMPCGLHRNIFDFLSDIPDLKAPLGLAYDTDEFVRDLGRLLEGYTIVGKPVNQSQWPLGEGPCTYYVGSGRVIHVRGKKNTHFF